VDELMSTAKCCRESDSVRDVAQLMRDESIGFVPICDQEGKPVGTITDRDLAIRVLAEGRSADEKVGACMTREVVSCKLGDDAHEAERLMREKRKSRIIICDEAGKVKGVISLADIVEAESEQAAGKTLQEVKSDQPTAH
jgi:signal-transduction protein with cAMP-binding, CBS, and nucleotidyltransferase domain